MVGGGFVSRNVVRKEDEELGTRPFEKNLNLSSSFVFLSQVTTTSRDVRRTKGRKDSGR